MVYEYHLVVGAVKIGNIIENSEHDKEKKHNHKLQTNP